MKTEGFAAPKARVSLPTECVNEKTKHLDSLPIQSALELLSRENACAVEAVRAAHEDIGHVIEMTSERLAAGGRLFYVGAGTSGRLGVLDAAECPPTFSVEPMLIQGVIAGGERALSTSVEQSEDDPESIAEELARRGLSRRDLVLGISAGGRAPCVHGAIRYARTVGAATAFLACVPFEDVPDEADVTIRLSTGPEPIAGSTRMKAGTATKLVLNAISTLAMVRLGKVHKNLMVDLQAHGNAKLTERALRLVVELAGVDRPCAQQLLNEAGWRVKTAVVMHAKGLDRKEADALLDSAGGRLRAALG